MSKKTKTTALVLMLIILTSKITGFFRDIVLAQTFGAGEITDAYLTALNIPVVLFDGISAALGTTFIPIYIKIKSSILGIRYIYNENGKLLISGPRKAPGKYSKIKKEKFSWKICSDVLQ